MNKNTFILTVIVGLMCLFLFKGLYNDPKKIQSPLIGKQFPQFKLKVIEFF